MKVMVVDDEKDFTNITCVLLQKNGYQTVGAFSEKQARKVLSQQAEEIGIALVDMYMEAPESGLALIAVIKKRYPWILPIAIASIGELDNAAKCMEAGAFSYLVKGDAPPELIIETVGRATREYCSAKALAHGLSDLRKYIDDFKKNAEDLASLLERLEDELKLRAQES